VGEKGKGGGKQKLGSLAQDRSTREGRKVITDRPTWWVLPDKEERTSKSALQGDSWAAAIAAFGCVQS